MNYTILTHQGYLNKLIKWMYSMDLKNDILSFIARAQNANYYKIDRKFYQIDDGGLRDRQIRQCLQEMKEEGLIVEIKHSTHMPSFEITEKGIEYLGKQF